MIFVNPFAHKAMTVVAMVSALAGDGVKLVNSNPGTHCAPFNVSRLREVVHTTRHIFSRTMNVRHSPGYPLYGFHEPSTMD
jgi:hypothetical protein